MTATLESASPDGGSRPDVARRGSRSRAPRAKRRRDASTGGRWAAFSVYLVLHELIVAGLPTPRFPTSVDYLHLDFTGRAVRLWAVPLLYKVLPTDFLRIAGQTALAAISWWILAWVAASIVRDLRVRIALQAIILALGLTGPIAGWNSTILSESASISFTALLIAAWLRYSQRPRATTALAAVAATIAWTFTRQDHVIVGLMITVVALVSAGWHRRGLLRVFVAGALVAVSITGFVSTSRNDEVDSLMSTIVALRVLPDPSYTSWFVDHGMPDTPAIQSFAGDWTPYELANDPDFRPWVRAHGGSTYLKFVLSHPRYTLWSPLPYLTGEEPSLYAPAPPFEALSPDPTPSLLSPDVNWGRHRDVVPRVLEDLLFGRGQIGDLVLLGGIGLALAAVSRRRYGWDRRLWVPAVVVASVIPHAYVVWLGSATELDRHAIAVAVSARIGLWLIVAFSLDRLLTGARAKDEV
jgi:hypothetical protein